MCDHWIGWYYDSNKNAERLLLSTYESLTDKDKKDNCVLSFNYCPTCGQKLNIEK